MRGPRSLHSAWKRRQNRRRNEDVRRRNRRALGEQLEPRLLLNVDVDYDFPKTVAQVLVDGAPPPGLLTVDPSLPPTDGVYRTAADVHAEFSGPGLQIILRDMQHRAFAQPPPVRTIVGANEVEDFQSSLSGTALVGGQSVPINLSGPVQTIVFGKGSGQTTGSWDTEMISMSLSGQLTTPAGAASVVVREDPDRASTGQTTVNDLGGGTFQIDSFFDVFTELSINGGPFVDSSDSARVEVVQSGIVTSDTQLPPDDGVYRTAPQVHAEFQGPGLQIVLTGVRHRAFAYPPPEIIDDNGSERELFESRLTGYAVVNGQFAGFTDLSGPVQTIVRDKGPGETTGSWDTEMLSMDLRGQAGFQPLMIRESPDNASTGRTRITDLGDGQFHIDSFFDVFTEVSLDAGRTWVPQTTSARVELGKSPELVTLVGPATVGVTYEGDNVGDARDDTGDGRDEVTSRLNMHVTGPTSRGPAAIIVSSTQPALGEISEAVQTDRTRLDIPPFGPPGSFGTANFNVSPIFQVGNTDLHGLFPLFLQSSIGNIPPQSGETFLTGPGLSQVLFAGNDATDLSVLRVAHQPRPTVENDSFQAHPD